MPTQTSLCKIKHHAWSHEQADNDKTREERNESFEELLLEMHQKLDAR